MENNNNKSNGSNNNNTPRAKSKDKGQTWQDFVAPSSGM